MKKLRKAVFPVAGLGTRFLPATKAIPKEMLTRDDIAQPARQDDSLRRSEEREDDPFDLPPAG